MQKNICSLLIISKHSDGKTFVDITSVEELGPSDEKDLQILLETGRLEKTYEDTEANSYCHTTYQLILTKDGNNLVNWDNSFVHANYFSNTGKTKKVLIGQESSRDIVKIKELLNLKRVNLEIEYVNNSVLEVSKKMREWKPDIVLTDKN